MTAIALLLMMWAQTQDATPKLQFDKGISVGKVVPAEPMVVPAVERPRNSPAIDYGIDCGAVAGLCERLYQAQRWTCDDTRRVLLTTEGGEKLCVLFPKEMP